MNHWLDCYQICISVLLEPTIDNSLGSGESLFPLKTVIIIFVLEIGHMLAVVAIKSILSNGVIA